mgnify:FL=1
MVEHVIRNDGVAGPIPASGSKFKPRALPGAWFAILFAMTAEGPISEEKVVIPNESRTEAWAMLSVMQQVAKDAETRRDSQEATVAKYRNEVRVLKEKAKTAFESLGNSPDRSEFEKTVNDLIVELEITMRVAESELATTKREIEEQKAKLLELRKKVLDSK